MKPCSSSNIAQQVRCAHPFKALRGKAQPRADSRGTACLLRPYFSASHHFGQRSFRAYSMAGPIAAASTNVVRRGPSLPVRMQHPAWLLSEIVEASFAVRRLLQWCS